MKGEIVKHSIIIDGPNLISRIIEKGIDKNGFVESFSLSTFITAVGSGLEHSLQSQLKQSSSLLGVEFYCSNKLPGPHGNKLSKQQWEVLTERLSKEDLVSVDKITIPGTHEKGVDVAVAVRLVEVSEICDVVCLVASDKDYVPVLQYLKRKGKYIITMGVEAKHPIELINLSYLFIDITTHLENLKKEILTITHPQKSKDQLHK
jgi:uncharacterized LabA/DUF88 family protein